MKDVAIEELNKDLLNTNWENNEVLLEGMKKAFNYLPYDFGWDIEGCKEMKPVIHNFLKGLEQKNYEIIGRELWEMSSEMPDLDPNHGFWLNTVHTDGSIDLKLVVDIMECLQPIGLLVPRAVETKTLAELASIFGHMTTAMRLAKLGLCRNKFASPGWFHEIDRK